MHFNKLKPMQTIDNLDLDEVIKTKLKKEIEEEIICVVKKLSKHYLRHVKTVVEDKEEYEKIMDEEFEFLVNYLLKVTQNDKNK